MLDRPQGMTVESCLRDIIAHWDNFGPIHGLSEKIDIARKFLRDRERSLHHA